MADLELGAIIQNALKQQTALQSQAGAAREDIQGLSGQATDFSGFSLPAEQSGLGALLPTLLSNVATGLSGNNLYAAQDNARVTAERERMARAKEMLNQLKVGDAISRKRDLLDSKIENLRNLQQQANTLGNFAKEAELKDLELKALAQRDKAHEDASMHELQLKLAADKENTKTHAQAIMDAAQARQTTGSPYLDSIRGISEVMNLGEDNIRQGMKDAKEKNRANYLKKNPEAAMVFNLARQSALQRFSKNGFNESIDMYIGKLQQLQFGKDEISAAVNKNFTEAEIDAYKKSRPSPANPVTPAKPARKGVVGNPAFSTPDWGSLDAISRLRAIGNGAPPMISSH